MVSRFMVDDSPAATGALVATGFTVRPVAGAVASLRYFAVHGEFASGLAAFLGGPLPPHLRAIGRTSSSPSADIVLAWRSPTETLLLSTDASLLQTLDRFALTRSDGCIVEQTGGVVVLVLAGPRANDLLSRLGSVDSIPALGESRTSRVADITVTTVQVHAAEFMLFLDRVYQPHLMEWIRVTAADFPGAPP